MSDDDFVPRFVRALIASGRVIAALGEAARWGDQEMVLQLLDRGVDVNAFEENGCTPLMLAASGGQLAVMRILLERGARINDRDGGTGKTALMWGLSALHSQSDYQQIIGLLLEYGADPCLPDIQGITPLKLAQRRGHCVAALLEAPTK